MAALLLSFVNQSSCGTKFSLAEHPVSQPGHFYHSIETWRLMMSIFI